MSRPDPGAAATAGGDVKQADISKLGKYEILGELGKGAMGVVYKGKDPFIERFVALKTVRTDMLAADDPEATVAQITRFKREAQAAGRINHPNIVAIYEYGEDGPTAFIAMEFIEGRDLKDYFDAHERFDIKGIVRIMSEALSALDYAHKHGIVHRDIKPANIMMTKAGEVKITDFGIARLESSNLTQAGAVMGTPSYMSPEQFMGQQVDNRSDLFSAGAVLYQLLTGEKPFTGSLTTIMHRVLHGQPEAPSVLNVQIPRGFDAVVAKAMAKRPEDRYQNAAEFAQAVRDVADGKVAAPPPPLPVDDGEGTMMDTGAVAASLAARAAPASAADDDEAMPAHGLADEGARRGEATMKFAGSSPAAAKAPPAKPALRSEEAAAAAAKGGSKGALIGAIAGGVLVVGGAVGYFALGSGGGKPAPQVPAPQAQIEQPAQPAVDDGAARAEQAAAAAKRDAEERARRQLAEEQQAAADARRRADEQARQQQQQQQQQTADAKRQADEQARQQQAADAKRLADEQARADQAAAEARRVADEQARQQQAAEAKRQQVAQAGAALGAVRTALAKAPCAILKAESGADGALTVTGATGEPGADGQLRTLIESTAPGMPYSLRIDAASRPMCDPLAAVSRLRERNQELPQPVSVQSSSPGAVFKNGQNLILELHGPNFPAYLQVDYFTLEGFVVHLLPNGLEKDNKVAAGGQRRLGDPAGGGRFWTVGQPFGRELIVVTASAKPLFPALRPEAEQAAGYLAELRKAVDAAAKAGGPAPVASALFITTVPN